MYEFFYANCVERPFRKYFKEATRGSGTFAPFLPLQNLVNYALVWRK